MLRVGRWVVRRADWLLVGCAGAFFCAVAAFYAGYLIDDAYISLRYARHWSAGQGPVFNVGERVEGYTNFLWVALGALFDRLGADPMTALRVTSAAASAMMLAWVARAGGVRALVWLLAAPSFGFWAITGMETALFAALLTCAVLRLERESEELSRGVPTSSLRPSLSTWLFVALALTRPEGVAVFALAHAIAWTLGGRSMRALRRHAVDAAGFAVAYGAYFLWRVVYYGALTPNTFRAKVTGGAEQWRTGLRALGDWAAAHPVFVAALLAVPILLVLPQVRLRIGSSADRRRLLGRWALCAAFVGYVVAVGGDFMPFFRFFVPLSGLLALVTASVVRVVMVDGRWALAKRSAVVAALAAVQAAAGLTNEQPMRAFVAHRTTVVGQEVGRFFAARQPADAWMAVNTAGSLPFESGLPTIDMLGLTDAAIAGHDVYVTSTGWAGHRRGWGAYVVARRPHSILWYNSAGLAEPHYLGDHQLADDPYFRFFYQRRVAALPVAKEGEVLARFVGAPFGPDGARAPELGVRYEVVPSPIRHTRVIGAQVTVVWFERREDTESLWDLIPEDPKARPEVDAFLDAAVARWRALPPAPFDPAARREVEAQALRAGQAAQNGDLALAKRLLQDAVARNGTARSPLVYQYVTNLAHLEGDVFLATQSQREALRLDPGNELYRRNLRALMTQPYARRSAD